MLGITDTPLITNAAIFITSWLVRDLLTISYFKVCFLGPLLLAIVIDRVPLEKDFEVDVSMQEIYW